MLMIRNIFLNKIILIDKIDIIFLLKLECIKKVYDVIYFLRVFENF